jgi:predicted hotdog family 3-hydroxylacyl-ACP dehydratase
MTVQQAQDILSLIPQRAPFVMVDEIIFSDDTTTRTKFRVKEDNIFAVDGFLKEPALIESIAQTVAVREGYISKLENKPVRLGYIGSVGKLVISGFPAVHDDMITEIKVENQVFNVILISGKIFCREQLLVHCEMKIFITSSK